MHKENSRTVIFKMGDIRFEYDERKNETNIKKHGISFKTAARVFFDYDRIELYDEEHSGEENRYDTIGDVSFGLYGHNKEITIGNITKLSEKVRDIIYVVYTERIHLGHNGNEYDVIRLISARYADDLERRMYYDKY